MAAVRIKEVGSVPWTVTLDNGERAELDERPTDRGASRHSHPGSETELYLHENTCPPNVEVDVHVHRTDEIIYVTAGELHLGARVLKAGDSVYIPGNTLYGFRSGPEGLSFLNFRGRRDNSHVMKDEFLAERAEARGSA